MSASRWDDAYRADSAPWDTGVPDPVLEEAVAAGVLVPGHVVEIGCGTGTNARFLAGRGFTVTAVDLAPTAIAKAQAHADAGDIAFHVHDVLADPLPVVGVDAVSDRGCFHVFDDADQRAVFAARVADALRPGGLWLSLVGSTEGGPREHGPPRRTARDLMDAVEPVLEVVSLERRAFGDLPWPVAAWRAVFRKRTEAAVPSGHRGH
jgi:SAM-dependent methyltransferase